MTDEKLLQKLSEYERKRFAYTHASGIMYYDGDTVAPPRSYLVRGDTMGELAMLSYKLSTGKRFEDMLGELIARKENFDAVTKRKIELLKRDYDEIKNVPAREYADYARLLVESMNAWREAKKNNSFETFLPFLTRVFETVKRFARYMAPDSDPYDTMLDRYEKGLTVKACDGFFGKLRARLVPLAAEIAPRYENVDDSAFRGCYPAALQREFSEYLMGVMGLDRERCIIGETEHPFTTNFSKYDVRITTHYYEDSPVSSMYSVIHEGGHALYELGVGDDITLGICGGGVSMAIHESQSRFYENIIGRSREFTAMILPYLRKQFAPRLDGVTPEEFWRVVTVVKPSLIRTEADEVTYALHVMVRYELEKQIVAGNLKVKDLPGEWNRLYREYLGVDVPRDSEGVLQDMHWADGNVGYFPSYAIGSAYGAQFLREMQKDIDVWGGVSKGDLTEINGWLCDRIWKYGQLRDPGELFESICGPLDPDVFIDYLAGRYGV